MYRLCNDTIGSLSNDGGDGNEDGKKAIGLISKTTTLHVHHAFLYISLPSSHEHNVECLISSFVKDVKMTSLTFLAKTEEENAAFQAVDILRIGQKLNGKYRLRSRPRI